MEWFPGRASSMLKMPPTMSGRKKHEVTNVTAERGIDVDRSGTHRSHPLARISTATSTTQVKINTYCVVPLDSSANSLYLLLIAALIFMCCDGSVLQFISLVLVRAKAKNSHFFWLPP